MKIKIIAIAFFVIGAVALANQADWPHSAKRYPVEVRRVISPTEFSVLFKDTKKIYTLRLAHVTPLESRNTKDDKLIKNTYDLAMRLVNAEIKRDPQNMFVEFEGDEIQFDGDSTNRIVGYLFLSPNWLVPLNCELMRKNRRTLESGKYFANEYFTTYMQESGKDSKGKAFFDSRTNVSY